ncbi:MAG: hypothetical protein UT55_C0008G0011 [Candidatus Peregrinibacteria bacterium GW2011_GWE2_39_6]|nr:MAG: hypothetical protein UT36_C0002G0067 [Candidatus Peregrinibacteria bacterium GW2011_GWF2_39_17]KKR26420.1 MAG: hypothetical protein UT55_C0008G0011 [Candidatus Peregrinibacteria bacterium GW2011_GWE2_39_6]HCW32171.1 ribonuclease P protein component [Candidatus Peregrinibacteria bacterium]
MLPRNCRLTKKDNFSAILQYGRFVKRDYLVARYRYNRGTQHRFSVVVSTKIASKAVIRNKIRRQIYEAIRLNLIYFPTERYFDIIILPHRAILVGSYRDIVKSLSALIPLIR